MRVLVPLLVLGAACGGPGAPTPLTTPAPRERAPSVEVQHLVAALTAHSPSCRIRVEGFATGEARISLDDAKPRTVMEPARQLPEVHWFMTLPFVDEAVVADRRAKEASRFAECMQREGPGPMHKGRDMHAEGCRVSFAAEGEAAPAYHYQRELGVDLPPYFSAPVSCEAAVVWLREALTRYPDAPS